MLDDVGHRLGGGSSGGEFLTFDQACVGEPRASANESDAVR
ncbi:hypothetical protein ACGF5C_32005 [Micromonospora sp. NPDC047620]